MKTLTDAWFALRGINNPDACQLRRGRQALSFDRDNLKPTRLEYLLAGLYGTNGCGFDDPDTRELAATAVAGVAGCQVRWANNSGHGDTVEDSPMNLDQLTAALKSADWVVASRRERANGEYSVAVMFDHWQPREKQIPETYKVQTPVHPGINMGEQS